MIKTATQLKALIKNKSQGDGTKAQLIIGNYIMERFLERLTISPYQSSIILKGGVLIASMLGVEKRSTVDIDATFKNQTLNGEQAQRIVEAITAIPLEDNVTFEIESVKPILEESEYPGICILLIARLEKLRHVFQVDFSTNDAITPEEINYSYPLLFEKRSIEILAYNLETILAEKVDTILSRETANTRMRDFYDVYALTTLFTVDRLIYKQALEETNGKEAIHSKTSPMSLIRFSMTLECYPFGKVINKNLIMPEMSNGEP